MFPWVLLISLLSSKGVGLSYTNSVVVGLLSVYILSKITTEHFESGKEDSSKKEKEKETPEPAPSKTETNTKSEPHVDVGTTILHAYKNLSPEQLGGMRRDTRELMTLQKELMGSLSEMKPAIEQGAELLKTFGTFFGKPEEATA